MVSQFANNLSLLCSYKSSIAEVCRRLGINRQQFNKYLSGRTRPSRSNMRRICDFFGVSEAEMMMDTHQLEQIIVLRRQPEGLRQDLGIADHLAAIQCHSQRLDKYLGYYYRYFYSFGNKGLVTRSLAVIYAQGEQYFWKNIEMLRDADTRRTMGINKYEGLVYNLADRIYITEYETLEKRSITQAILYPSHQHRLTRLVGIQTGGPTRRGRKPGASKVALDFLGKRIDLRKALMETGFYHPDSHHLSRELVQVITNQIAEGSLVFEVDEP
ncbi:hypothetical protein BOO69_17730 [Sulfitobacter alexandrii]|uniref:HTH cro/C1-type domain-containing protein n=2 Tax=Sulfitobacter alexandrii TaxID=1917485 RepID=A0A1J0WLJ6_9RHOB|nr:hypothetical protein BOO69_17730 [Sulfitobacter alexandrii]